MNDIIIFIHQLFINIESKVAMQSFVSAV